jgi:autotransporter translocation and assembly factor TamB
VRRLIATLLAIALVPAAVACRGQAETPPEVAQAYRALEASLDERVPGSSFARLRDFARQNGRYAVSAEAASALEAWRAKMDTAYRNSRDLAREGRYGEAEAILNDLASVTDEAAGREARAFLAYEFHKLKASRLLVGGDVEGAEAAARELRERPLTEAQRSETERLLDATALVDAGVRMTRATAFRSAARAVQSLLHSTFAEEGRFPATLALDSPALDSLRGTGLLSGVAAIEGYTATQDTFSFVLVGRDPTERLRVTQSGIEADPAR